MCYPRSWRERKVFGVTVVTFNVDLIKKTTLILIKKYIIQLSKKNIKINYVSKYKNQTIN